MQIKLELNDAQQTTVGYLNSSNVLIGDQVYLDDPDYKGKIALFVIRNRVWKNGQLCCTVSKLS